MLLQLIGLATVLYLIVRGVQWAIKQDLRERTIKRLTDLWKTS